MKFKLVIIFAVLLFMISANIVFAQTGDQLTLSIVPPLIKNNVSPGQIWKSSVKLVNNNTRPIDVYVEVLDFKSGDEEGRASFIHDSGTSEEADSYLLSRWVKLESDSVKIPPEASKEISFIVDVPENAEPGGHYVAILAGTKPPKEKNKGTTINVSSQLASLLLITVSGDIKELGRIREFSTPKTINTEDNINFVVKFENIGNVHIIPRGEIQIVNTLNDKVVERMMINHNTEFGNVLPESIRKWNLNWKNEIDFFKQGRYKAVLILSYGEETVHTIDQTIYFWIVYPKKLLVTIGTVLLVILSIVLLIRIYIRRAIIKTQKEVGIVIPGKNKKNKKSSVIVNENGTDDHRLAIGSGTKNKIKKKSKKIDWSIFSKYIKLIIFILLLILAFVIYIYYQRWTVSNTINFDRRTSTVNNSQDQKVENDTPNAEIQPVELIENLDHVASDEVATSTENSNTETKEVREINKDIKIQVLNGSGEPGIASRVAELIKQQGYNNLQIGNADNYNYEASSITYNVEDNLEAIDISKIFVNKIEFIDTLISTNELIIIVGKDHVK